MKMYFQYEPAQVLRLGATKWVDFHTHQVRLSEYFRKELKHLSAVVTTARRLLKQPACAHPAVHYFVIQNCVERLRRFEGGLNMLHVLNPQYPIHTLYNGPKYEKLKEDIRQLELEYTQGVAPDHHPLIKQES